jgi:hypothetical protein
MRNTESTGRRTAAVRVAATVAASALLLAGCGSAAQTAHNIGDKASQGASDAGGAVKSGAQDTGNAVKDGGDKAGNALGGH